MFLHALLCSDEVTYSVLQDLEVIKPEIVGENFLRAVYDGFLIAARCYLTYVKRIEGLYVYMFQIQLFSLGKSRYEST